MFKRYRQAGGLGQDMAFAVTAHAIERYVQRVEPISEDDALEKLTRSKGVVMLAASIGCISVRLGCGARLILDGETIVTVYPPANRQTRNLPRQLRANA